MSRSIMYYITGHGFGHARRSAALIRRLVAHLPELTVHIRTSAPEQIFYDTLGPHTIYHHSEIDPGAVEHDALRIDTAATAQRVREFMADRERIIAAELKSLPADLRLVVADTSFLAGDVAAAAGVPAIAIGNFTWDWIYEPFLVQLPGGREIVEQIQKSYAKMAAIVKLPFGGRTDMFRQVIQSPVIATGRRYSREQVLGRMGIEHLDGRPLVLIGQRGGISGRVLDRAAGASPEVCFLCPHRTEGCSARNVIPIPLNSELRFADLLYACDAVVSKLGHGTVSECIAANVGMLFPRRVDFCEDEVIAREAGPYMRLREITTGDFESGNWETDLAALLKAPMPERQLPSDGDRFGAQVLARWL